MTPHLVIDARLYGPRHTGIGRYTQNLLRALNQLPAFRHYQVTLLVYPEIEDTIRLDLGNRFHYRVTRIRHYSLSEQLFLPIILYFLRPTLVHFTHFNKPILYFGKSLVTIHDLIKHFSLGPDTTTRSPWAYQLKHLAYRALTFITIKTTTLLVPSDYWKDYLQKNYHLSPSRITTTHEAVDPNLISPEATKLLPPANPPYLLYTGNLYPHKNVSVILRALPLLPDYKLYLIGAKSTFTDRITQLARQLKVTRQIKFLGYLADSEFQKIYAKALCLVHPSFLEGFSLTGLEAMALNCPVIAARASCLPEIYGRAALYFNPSDPTDLVTQVNRLAANKSFRQKIIAQGHRQVKKYSWEQTARLTLSVYRQLLFGT